MSNTEDFETYISISPTKFGIYLFNINTKTNLYKQEIFFEKENENIDLNHLGIFLEDNIFKIEKLVGNFIKNIFLIIENDEILSVTIGIKKKNYENVISKKNLENTITDIKDLFRENYQDVKILHMFINRYLVNGQDYQTVAENLIADNYCIEVNFKFISKSYILEISKVLEKYQIEVIKHLDGKYIRNFYNEDKSDIAEIAHRIQSDSNQNEVIIVPKNTKKMGFFEKFFQLFS